MNIPDLGPRSMRLNMLCLGLLVLSIMSGCKEKEPPEEKEKILETKTGKASYYGRYFDGKKTASGEIFDSRAMVAAHPTYPLGTVVRVTNLSNQDTVTVRISDRGPTQANRKEGVIIDLSRGAGEKINMTAEGRVDVQVDVLAWGEDQPK